MRTKTLTPQEAARRAHDLANALATVFGVLTDRGAEALEELARAEGLLWRCTNCNWNVSLDEDYCDNCGKPAWGAAPDDADAPAD